MGLLRQEHSLYGLSEPRNSGQSIDQKQISLSIYRDRPSEESSEL